MQYNQDVLFHREEDSKRVTEEQFLDNLKFNHSLDQSSVYPYIQLSSRFCHKNENGKIEKEEQVHFS